MVNIPSSVTSIGNNAFSNTQFLVDSEDENGLNIVTAYDNDNYKFLLGYTSNLKSNITAEMLDGVCVIAEYAFYKSTELASITIPSDVKHIGNSAFLSCSSLMEVTIVSQEIVNIMTSQTDASGSHLVYNATTIYIKSNLSAGPATYLMANFIRQSSSDKVGYDKWVKNS